MYVLIIDVLSGNVLLLRTHFFPAIDVCLKTMRLNWKWLKFDNPLKSITYQSPSSQGHWWPLHFTTRWHYNAMALVYFLLAAVVSLSSPNRTQKEEIVWKVFLSSSVSGLLPGLTTKVVFKPISAAALASENIILKKNS